MTGDVEIVGSTPASVTFFFIINKILKYILCFTGNNQWSNDSTFSSKNENIKKSHLTRTPCIKINLQDKLMMKEITLVVAT